MQEPQMKVIMLEAAILKITITDVRIIPVNSCIW